MEISKRQSSLHWLELSKGAYIAPFLLSIILVLTTVAAVYQAEPNFGE